MWLQDVQPVGSLGNERASKRPAGQPPIYDDAEIRESNTGGQVEQFELGKSGAL